MHSVIGFISSKFIPKKKQHIAVGVYVTCSTKALVIADFRSDFGQKYEEHLNQQYSVGATKKSTI